MVQVMSNGRAAWRTGAGAAEAGLPAPLRAAVAAHRAGRREQARSGYQSFLAEHPSHPTALQLAGLLHAELGEIEPAIRCMQESLRLFPQQPEVENNLGNALAAAGRRPEAVDCYARAVRLAPKYQEAWRNLGLCYLELDLPEDARRCFERCVAISPDDAVSWLALGNAHQRCLELEQAAQCLRRAIELRPDYAEAWHNLGVCLRMQQQPEQALTHFAEARRLGLARTELLHNQGSALVDLGRIDQAIEAYRAALQADPLDLRSHQDLNKLLWEQAELDGYLASYRSVLAEHPDAVDLRLQYAVALRQREQNEEAERVLMQGLRRAPESTALKNQLGYVLEQQGRWDDAVRIHAAVAAMPGATPNHRISYARALLACGRPEQALEQAVQAAAQTPLDQRALAYLGLCWRVLGDERDAVLNDYQNLVRIYEVPVPAGFSDAKEFNTRLAEVLHRLHVAKQYPPEQSLRGGTQTHGNLFDRRDAEISGLVAGLNACIEDYLARMPAATDHPLHSRRTATYGYATSWSVRLQRCGFHAMHVHPLGWLSSAYYVELPAGVRNGSSGGELTFGQPDIDLGPAGAARRIVRPGVGRLVLFPSYMWHGTVPFEDEGPRTTVAFDVVPLRAPAAA